MPQKPKRPCRFRNCPRLVNSESGYCVEHEKLMCSNYNRFGRAPESRKRYNYQWRKLRARFLNQNPLCEMCKRQGRYTQATEVHHIKPLSEGGDNDIKNLMALCHSCHSRITISHLNKK